MKKDLIKKKIKELEEKISYHRDLYFNKSKSEISDFEYDKMVEELEKLEKIFPKQESNNISEKIGAPLIKSSFEKEKHDFPMLSLKNSYSKKDFETFYKKICKNLNLDSIDFFCELKIDGVAISLIYEDGILKKGITRGDGSIGENVSSNIFEIDSIPKMINSLEEKIEIRGEIFIKKSQFEILNKDRIKKGEEKWANPRNLASGSIKLLDSSECRKRKLSFLPYSIVSKKNLISSQEECFKKLKELGFDTLDINKKIRNLDDIFNFLDEIEREKKNFDIESDGIVLKVDSIKLQEELGFTSHSPRWAIAYKFNPENKSTKLNKILYQLGRSGAVTPVAVFEKINLGGTNISRASLFNKDFIENLDLHENDFIYIKKGGDVIPKIFAVDISKRDLSSKKIEFIKNCPSCGSILENNFEESTFYCRNSKNCIEQKKAKVLHFVSKQGMDIKEIGEKLIENLFEKNLINSIKDLYLLEKSNLENLPLFKEKSINNFFESIEKSKNQRFDKFLFSLSIKHMGEVSANQIARNFKSIENIKKASIQDFQNIPDIGEKLANSLKNFFEDKENLKMIDFFEKLGFNLSYNQESSSSKYLNKKIVISGSFPEKSRNQIKKIIEEQGGFVFSSISKTTDILICGTDPSEEKLEKARKYQTKIQNYF
jgi:DNA ligase (NAD+)